MEDSPLLDELNPIFDVKSENWFGLSFFKRMKYLCNCKKRRKARATCKVRSTCKVYSRISISGTLKIPQNSCHLCSTYSV